MTEFWRPFETEDDIEENTVSGMPEKKSTRCSVSKKEEEVILHAYKSCTGGWDRVLKCVQEKVQEFKGGDYLKQQKIKAYYKTTPNKAALKRIQRVVNKSLKKVEEGLSTQTTQSEASNSMVESIKKSKARYSEKLTSEERRQKKLELIIDSSSDDSTAPPSSHKRKTPETEEELKKKDGHNDSKPARKLSKRRKKQDASQEAHTTMCERAMGIMDKISKVLDKYDSSD